MVFPDERSFYTARNLNSDFITEREEDLSGRILTLLLHTLLDALLQALFVEAFGKSAHGLRLVGIVALIFGPFIIIKRCINVDEIQVLELLLGILLQLGQPPHLR